MPFRRLKHKTQVFFSPENDHICTRIEHVLHVATIASTVCKGLNQTGKWDLDSELAYAIGLGHDLGHAPFGHAGEEALYNCTNQEFRHEMNSFRVVRFLANDGKGLNLTYAVEDGIISHNGEKIEQSLSPCSELKSLEKIRNRDTIPNTYEGCIVRFADKIAYLGRDIEDAIISGLITSKDVPETIRPNFGKYNGQIINELVTDLIRETSESDKIQISDNAFEMINSLSIFNYEMIYTHKKIQKYKRFIEPMIRQIYEYLQGVFFSFRLDYDKYSFDDNLQITQSFGKYLRKMEPLYLKESFQIEQILTDYISGMTDNYVLKAAKEITIPKPL
jgi:dGTPase